MHKNSPRFLSGLCFAALSTLAACSPSGSTNSTNSSDNLGNELANVAAPDLVKEPEFKAGQDYADVRKRLLGAGWIPAEYDAPSCSPYGYAPGEECHDRPEILNCSGTGKGYCEGYWIRRPHALRIVTIEGPDGAFDHSEKLEAKSLPEVARNANVQLTGAAAKAIGVKSIKVTEAWLVGSWGPSRTKSAHEACGTDSIVSFARDGTYRDGEGYGRYSLEGRKVTYFNRVLVDEAAETEDRSQFDESVEQTILPLSNQSMSEDGQTWYRCTSGE
ncbi:MAG: hypothetical protein IIZ38_11090 [Sphingomonas sp.]|uniref:hypothetical protein n=1 Tax=Sphingomonas sp. TaxID=28214 RepID=UPI0025E80DF0|nr:hypothetical protein [Sphingomonas sp.]MBQ1498848.1 hypothetical protein [Sphingomonas sp.]MBQ8106678.1 hypothetical protein [Afipia sp.]